MAKHLSMSEQISDTLFDMQAEDLRDLVTLLVDAIDDVRAVEGTYYGVIAKDGTGASWKNLRQAEALDNYDAAIEELTGMAS